MSERNSKVYKNPNGQKVTEKFLVNFLISGGRNGYWIPKKSNNTAKTLVWSYGRLKKIFWDWRKKGRIFVPSHNVGAGGDPYQVKELAKQEARRIVEKELGKIEVKLSGL